jgi:hypothetical protein
MLTLDSLIPVCVRMACETLLSEYPCEDAHNAVEWALWSLEQKRPLFQIVNNLWGVYDRLEKKSDENSTASSRPPRV